MPEGTYTEEDILKAENAVEDLDRLNQELAKTAEGYGVDTNEVVKNAMTVDPVASVRVGDSAVGELAEQYSVNLDETDDNTVAEDTVEEVVEEAEKVNNSDLAVGDVVTLSPELADNVPNYDPSDEFRIIEIDNGLVSLSRNGVADENLAYVAIEELSKYNYVDPRIVSFQEQEIDEINETEENNVVTEYEDVYSDSSMIPDGQVETENVVEETVENETIENNVEEVAEPTEEKEEKPIIEKGSKPIRWAKHFLDKIRKNTSVEGISEKLQESIDKDKAGKTLSFKTALYGKELKLAKAASSKWTQIKGWFKKDKAEVIEDEPVVTEENDNIEETNLTNETVVDTDVRTESKDNDISKVANNEEPYKVFSQLTPEKQADVLNLLLNMAKDITKENDDLIKVTEEANEAIKKQNDTIEELTKNNNMVNENTDQIDNNQVNNDSVQTNDGNEDTLEKSETTKETVDSRFQVYDAYKKQLDEQRAQEEKRRALEADQEKLWNEELAPFIDNEKFVQTASQHAESVIETEKQDYYNSVVIPEQQKREELLNQTRIDSLKNKINANAIKGTLTPEMINQLNNVFNNQEENENQPKTRR